LVQGDPAPWHLSVLPERGIPSRMEWPITFAAIALFGGLTVFAGWMSGRPHKDSLKVQWISWPLVTVMAATAAIFAIIHVVGMLGYETGGNALRGYGP
jgi:fatty acid desaturase